MTEQNDSINLFEHFESLSEEFRKDHPLVFNYTKRYNLEGHSFYSPDELIDPEEVAAVTSQGFFGNVNRNWGINGEGMVDKTLFTGRTISGKPIVIDKVGVVAILNMFSWKGRQRDE